jgi:AraC-like DNA-binding protein
MKTSSARTPATPLQLPRLEYSGRFASAKDVALHQHNGIELVYINEGSCEINVGVDLTGHAGALFVLPPRVPQVTRILEFTRTSYVVFSTQPTFFDHTPRVINIPTTDLAVGWLEQVCDLFQAGQNYKGEAVSVLLLAVLTRINEFEQRQTLQRKLHPSVIKALAYLETHWSEHVLNSDLASAAHISQSHLNVVFREQLGTTPRHYLLQLRIRAAQRLLRDPYRTVKQVARECGFDDEAYFVRVFRKITGTPPGKWRNTRKPT